jgi:hypothetical protein
VRRDDFRTAVWGRLLTGGRLSIGPPSFSSDIPPALAACRYVGLGKLRPIANRPLARFRVPASWLEAAAGWRRADFFVGQAILPAAAFSGGPFEAW